MAMAVRLNHMSVQVRSLEASAKFYQEVLQLPEIECGARKANIRWFALGDGQSVHLIEGDFGKTFVTMSTHFCISSSDLDGTIRHLTAKGAKFCQPRQRGREAANSRRRRAGRVFAGSGWVLD